MEDGEHSKELDIAVRVVHLACALCRRVQEGLLENGNAQVKAKDDDSPVTIAGILSLFLLFYRCSFSYCLLNAFSFNFEVGTACYMLVFVWLMENVRK